MTDYFIPWFRMFHDWVDDPKIIPLNWQQRGIYIGMLSYLNKYQRPENKTVINIEMLGHFLRIDTPLIEETLELFLDLKLINKNVQGYYCHPFKERQKTYDKSTARVHKHREQMKQNETFQERSDNVRETEKDKIRKEKKRKDVNPDAPHPVYFPFDSYENIDKVCKKYDIDIDQFVSSHVQRKIVVDDYASLTVILKAWKKKGAGIIGDNGNGKAHSSDTIYPEQRDYPLNLWKHGEKETNRERLNREARERGAPEPYPEELPI